MVVALGGDGCPTRRLSTRPPEDLTTSNSGTDQSDSDSSTCTEDTSDSSAGSGVTDASCSRSDGSDSSISTAEDDDASESSSRVLPQCEDEYAAKVHAWTERVPIGLGLCPWAMKSQRRGRVKYTTCEGSSPSEVATLILSETKALCRLNDGIDVDAPPPPPPLSTTLIVCPHVTAWNSDFRAFDDFVKSVGRQNEQLLKEGGGESPHYLFDLRQEVTLVSFHPEFLRWHGLPKGIGIGSAVQSHRGMGGFQKSRHTFSATVIETGNRVFGLRRVKVQFHDDLKEQYVPIDWFVAAPQQSSIVNSSDDGAAALLGPPLPDNAMHRSPYPTVHLIRNEDLGTLCIRDVSRVKRKNAQRMMKLGWEGVILRSKDGV